MRFLRAPRLFLPLFTLAERCLVPAECARRALLLGTVLRAAFRRLDLPVPLSLALGLDLALLDLEVIDLEVLDLEVLDLEAALGLAAVAGRSSWSITAVTVSIEAMPSTPLRMPLSA